MNNRKQNEQPLFAEVNHLTVITRKGARSKGAKTL